MMTRDGTGNKGNRMKALSLALAAGLAWAGSAFAQDSVESFYKGNTITINVPSSAGGT